ncbi:D-tyrosyl-tRNA(Tyr) deacylase [Candidatus Woesearchaeota archaeon]|nr:D-tyrosyl-tRNA(Tyr) deacylase [Candidatus Woesearchaeota archaeon]
MKTAIIVSKKDPAGINIAEHLRKYNLDSSLHFVEEDTILSNDLDKKIEADLFIFATRHQSAKGVHSLSCHSAGNWGKAEAGGKDSKLCIAPAVLLKEAFLVLNRLGKDMHHETTLEVTHHGPYLEKPCMFIEIGSDEKNWKNKEAGDIIAKVIIDLLKNIDEIISNKNNYKITFGIGGPHYASTFNRRILETDIAIGHICPKYQLENLDKEMVLQAVEKTVPKVDFVLLDWKGLGKEKQRIINLLDGLGIKYKKTDQIK